MNAKQLEYKKLTHKTTELETILEGLVKGNQAQRWQWTSYIAFTGKNG